MVMTLCSAYLLTPLQLFVVCHQDEYACGYFEEVDPQYPSRAMEVIDDLVADMRDARDMLLEERNNQY